MAPCARPTRARAVDPDAAPLSLVPRPGLSSRHDAVGTVTLAKLPRAGQRLEGAARSSLARRPSRSARRRRVFGSGNDPGSPARGNRRGRPHRGRLLRLGRGRRGLRLRRGRRCRDASGLRWNRRAAGRGRCLRRAIARRRRSDRRRLGSRQEQKRVDVPVRLRSDAHAEIDVRLRELRYSARAHGAHDASLRDRLSSPHRVRAEM